MVFNPELVWFDAPPVGLALPQVPQLSVTWPPPPPLDECAPELPLPCAVLVADPPEAELVSDVSG